MPSSPIRVLLVDDSIVSLEVLHQILSGHPDIEVVGKAKNGEEAWKLIPLVKPNIVCTDFYMPYMDGLQLTKKIMETDPIPILVMSSKVDPTKGKEYFSIMEAGALDFIKKPKSLDPNEEETQQMIDKIRVLSRVYVLKKSPKIPSPQKMTREMPSSPFSSIYKILVIGASTGGPLALRSIFQQLPANFPIPIVCIQHISEGFLSGFADWLQDQCKLNIKIIHGKEEMESGVVYLPKENTHLEFTENYEATISHALPVNGHRPSIDFSMKSAAKIFRQTAIGVLLSGMGDDGAEGLLEMRRKGALTIAQSESSCVVFGMPQEAIALGAAVMVLDLNSIGPYITNKMKSVN